MRRYSMNYLLITVSVLMIAFSAVAEENQISIASFNIQVFGKSKSEKAEVMDILAEIISRYDVVAIQEIKQKPPEGELYGSAIELLEEKVDDLGEDYDFVISPRVGSTSSRTEQYAFMYRKRSVTVNDSGVYDDTGAGFFDRDPFYASFSAGSFSFVLLTIHTPPDYAEAEINSLPEAVSALKTLYPEEDDFIVLGDLNADGDYFDETDMSSPLRGDDFIWLIENDADTNVAASERTYDRIIMTTGASAEYAGQSGVFRFDEELDMNGTEPSAVSDHYPVWSVFNTGSQEQQTSPADSGGGGGGCFIASAVYKDDDCMEVKVLQEFCRRYILTSETGRVFIENWNFFSEKAFSRIKGNPAAVKSIRGVLFPVAGFCRMAMACDLPLSIIIVTGIFFMFFPVVLMVVLVKRFKV